MKNSLVILLLCLASNAHADKVLRHVVTGQVYSTMPDSASTDTMIGDAVSAGVPKADIEVVQMTPIETKLAITRGEWGSDLTIAKTRRIKEIRIEARKILSDNTDWYVVRKYENGTAIPAPVTNYRAAIRQVVQDSVTAINALTMIDAARDYKPVWPDAPGE